MRPPSSCLSLRWPLRRVRTLPAPLPVAASLPRGWTGQVDAGAEKAGQTVNDTKLTQTGKTLQVTTGPAASFWNPADKASGNYTVSATFNEAKYMNLNSHPHPYGIFIAGNGLGTPEHSELYCAAYGNGNFIVRGFGPESFQMNGHGEAERCGAQGGRPRRTCEPDHCPLGERGQSGVCHQWHGGCELREG